MSHSARFLLRTWALVFAGGALGVGGSVLAQDSHASLPGEEGPLNNDSFLPASTSATARLASGDEAYAKLVASGPLSADAAERAWGQVFESWRAALVESASGESVPPRPIGANAVPSPWPDPDGTAERRTEGIEYALLRRIAALAPEVRRAWTARFEGLAEQALAAAGQAPPALAEIERLHPATSPAARAALALAELAFEEGRSEIALAWLARAERHVALAGLAGTPLEQALRRREQLLSQGRREPAGRQGTPEAWTRATDVRPLGQVAIQDLRRRAVPAELSPGVGVQPGLCFLENGLAAVQSADRVFLLDPTKGSRSGDFEPAKLIETAGWETGAAYATPEAPGWPLVPATDGRALVLVQGRTLGEHENALVCASFAQAFEREERGPLFPELTWAVSGNRRLEPGGRVVSLEGELALEHPEFQPGPVVAGSQVVVQVRELAPAGDEATSGLPLFTSEGEIRSWLVAFDLASGAVRWKRFLGKGVDLSRSVGRFVQRNFGRSAAQPLASLGERVLASTHTGSAVLLDLADGRVAWSLKNRRRDADGRGWSGARAPIAFASGLAWGPADGDFLYVVRGEPDLEGRGLFLVPPRAMGEAEVLAGGGAGEALVLGRAGRARTASAWDLATGGRLDAPELAPGESFSGEALASAERLYVATDRSLVLYDRTRELYLLDSAPLEKLDFESVGGSVYARGERVFVVGPRVVWLFEAR